MHSPLKIKLTDLNPHLTCIICGGYFINATTITECLHSFCRSCIVKYLETNKYCPICEVQIHKTKPLLNLRSDQTLQDIVYKLVPGLFQNEMQRRRTFYASNPIVAKPTDPEQSGELSERSYIYTSEDYISLSLEYYNNNNNDSVPGENQQSRRYLRCPAAVSILHLQKLIRAKYELTKDHKVDILYQNDALCEDFTLIDVAYIYLWKRKGPLHLTYRIFETECRKKLKLNNDFHQNATSNSEEMVEKDDKYEATDKEKQDRISTDVQSTQCFLDSSKLIGTSLSSNEEELINKNNNNISSDKLVLNELVMCESSVVSLNGRAVSEKPRVNTTKNFTQETAALDKEVHLQISETGIISVTTSIASSEITQTIATVATPITSPTLAVPSNTLTASSVITTLTTVTTTVAPQSTTVAPLVTTTSTSVIPNILRLPYTINKKSDLKSVRKQTNLNKSTAMTTAGSLIAPVSTQQINSHSVIPLKTLTVQSSSATTNPIVQPPNSTVQLKNVTIPLNNTLAPVNIIESSNSEQRKRKLSTDSQENTTNTVKKSSVSQKVPFSVSTTTTETSNSATSIITTAAGLNTTLKLSKLSPPQSLNQPTLITTKINNNKQTINTNMTSTAMSAVTSSTVGISSVTSMGLSSVTITTCNSKKPLITQQTITTSQIQPPINKPNTNIKPLILPTTPTVRKTQMRTIGYKTLRDPPKTWNPTLPPRSNITHPYNNATVTPSNYMPDQSKLKTNQSITYPASSTTISSTMNNQQSNTPVTTNSVPSLSNPVTKPKPNKFFKVRNNMPRYLGNPASGVKPMYQISTPTTTASTPSVKSTIDSINKSRSHPSTLPTALSTPISTSSSTAVVGTTATTTNISNKSINVNKIKPSDTKNLVISTSNTLSNDKANIETDTKNKQNNSEQLDQNKPLSEIDTKDTSIASVNEKSGYQPQRNSLKLPMSSSRNSPMTVSEMLQLRNNSKTKTENQQKNEKLATETVSSNDIKNKLDNKNKSETTEIKTNSSKVGSSSTEQPSSSEKVDELKITQTTVPIYNPRPKQKNDLKMQKNANSNLRIDIHINSNLRIDIQNSDQPNAENNSPLPSKLTFNPQSSTPPLLDCNSPKLNKNVPSSPKLDRGSPKTIVSSPNSPKNIPKLSPTMQISPIYDQTSSPKLKNQSNAQVDRTNLKNMKINQQMFKISSPKGQTFDCANPKNITKTNSLETKTSGNSSTLTKSSIVGKNLPLSPKTCTTASGNKTDLNNIPAQKFNYMPPNPFIPNLSSPNLSPNQFLFSNYAINAAMCSYDPRLHNLTGSMDSLANAYHNLPLSLSAMLYNQYSGLPYSPPPPTVTSGTATNNTTVASSVSTTSLTPTTATATPLASTMTSGVDLKDAKTKSKDKNCASLNKK